MATKQRRWMYRVVRTVAVVAVVAVVATGAAGCGLDPSHAPLDAKKTDFCTAWARLAEAGASTSSGDMKDYVNEFARFGTPRGIPTAARKGYEYVIDPDHAFSDGRDLAALATQTDANGKDVAALKTYATALCA